MVFNIHLQGWHPHWQCLLLCHRLNDFLKVPLLCHCSWGEAQWEYKWWTHKLLIILLFSLSGREDKPTKGCHISGLIQLLFYQFRSPWMKELGDLGTVLLIVLKKQEWIFDHIYSRTCVVLWLVCHTWSVSQLPSNAARCSHTACDGVGYFWLILLFAGGGWVCVSGGPIHFILKPCFSATSHSDSYASSW